MELPSQSEFVQFDPNIDIGGKKESYKQYDLFEARDRKSCKSILHELPCSSTFRMNWTDDIIVDNKFPYQYEQEVFDEDSEDVYAPLNYARGLSSENYDILSEDNPETDTFSRRRAATPENTLQYEKTGPFVVPGHTDNLTSSKPSHHFREPQHIFAGTREKPEEMRSNAGVHQHLHAPDGSTSLTDTTNSVQKQFVRETVPTISRADRDVDRPIYVKRGLCLSKVAENGFCSASPTSCRNNRVIALMNLSSHERDVKWLFHYLYRVWWRATIVQCDAWSKSR